MRCTFPYLYAATNLTIYRYIKKYCTYYYVQEFQEKGEKKRKKTQEFSFVTIELKKIKIKNKPYIDQAAKKNGFSVSKNPT